MTISDVADKFGITADTLRYYEKAGLLPRVNRRESGIRDYSAEDINWVEFITCMRSAGISVETLAKYIALFYEGDETLSARKQLLIDEREHLAEKMAEMQKTLDRLDFKIANYENIIVEKQKELLKETK